MKTAATKLAPPRAASTAPGRSLASGLSSFFSAPAKYLGDQTANLGGTLVFSLSRVSNRGTVINPLPPAVALQSGTTVLVLDLGAVASAAQFAAVLRNLTHLYLAGEFLAPVVETNNLDSVIMRPAPTPVPIPAGFWLMAPAVLGLGIRRRVAGSRC